MPDTPPSSGPMGRALQAARQLGSQRREGWWHWDVPGQRTPLRLWKRTMGNYATACTRASCTGGMERHRPDTF